ncbi:hypothetical protein NK718_13420 [Alsobacter sp. SYSU M60028]|uniref:Uncharacterized protein n=1 Tax=Alsobacter ponti TaxID=2962936 RepID=A0ABT1LDD7_9HYPH|nr:hypothetical protein [Alsobacter ponti]MCP8939520.1 hypothetical protein [Alsobacter ponti]
MVTVTSTSPAITVPFTSPAADVPASSPAASPSTLAAPLYADLFAGLAAFGLGLDGPSAPGDLSAAVGEVMLALDKAATAAADARGSARALRESSQFQSSQATLQALVATRAQIATDTATRDAKAEEKTLLEAQKVSADQVLASAVSALQSLDATIGDLTAAVASTRQALTSPGLTAAQVTALRAQLAQQEADLAAAQGRRPGLVADRDAAQGTVDGLARDIAVLADAIQVLDTTIAANQATLSTLNSILPALLLQLAVSTIATITTEQLTRGLERGAGEQREARLEDVGQRQREIDAAQARLAEEVDKQRRARDAGDAEPDRGALLLSAALLLLLDEARAALRGLDDFKPDVDEAALLVQQRLRLAV